MGMSNKGYNESDKTPMTFLWKVDEDFCLKFYFLPLAPF